MKVYVVLGHYTDGSPATDTDIDGVFSTQEKAWAYVGNSPTKDPGFDGGSWWEVRELALDVPHDPDSLEK